MSVFDHVFDCRSLSLFQNGSGSGNDDIDIDTMV
jgi:hypothetical protein